MSLFWQVIFFVYNSAQFEITLYWRSRLIRFAAHVTSKLAQQNPKNQYRPRFLSNSLARAQAHSHCKELFARNVCFNLNTKVSNAFSETPPRHGKEGCHFNSDLTTAVDKSIRHKSLSRRDNYRKKFCTVTQEIETQSFVNSKLGLVPHTCKHTRWYNCFITCVIFCIDTNFTSTCLSTQQPGDYPIYFGHHCSCHPRLAAVCCN